MIVDSSVAAAICFGESDAETYAEILADANNTSMSAATYVESGIVIDSRRPGAFDHFVTGLSLVVVELDREQAELARVAFRTYGRGSGHPARLNLGDCFSYALAVSRGEPLLFKGDDFNHTDVQRVWN